MYNLSSRLFFLFTISFVSVSYAQAEIMLKPCPDSPNCVSSLASDARHHVESFTFTDNSDQAQLRLKKAVLALPRMKLVKSEPGYMHFVQTSLIFRFRDDLEFLLNSEENAFHVRSASRVGYSDLGVNRKRVEAIRKGFK